MTIDEIITRHKAWAKTNKRESFFNPASMAFFATKVFPKVYEGQFFITSERYQATEYGKMYCGFKDGPIGYTIRRFHLGEILTCCTFQQFSTFEDAEDNCNSAHIKGFEGKIPGDT